MLNKFSGSEEYVASADLMSSVNVAITLEKPLLIKGEPGTGKTMLAKAISESLGKELITWNIKSTTKAQEGLYVYDVVQRLYDSQFGNQGVDDIAHYITMGKLGEAFESDEQVVVLIDEIDKLIEAGVDSFKIEGRMKTVFYVATVIRSYRQAIDAYYNGVYNEEIAKKYMDEIKKASHRHFTKGFFYNKADSSSQIYENSSYIRNYDFIAVVLDYDKENKIAKLEERNRFVLGDEVEIFGNSPDFIKFKIENMKDSKGNDIEVANKAKQIVYIKIDHDLKKGDMVRRKIDE